MSFTEVLAPNITYPLAFIRSLISVAYLRALMPHIDLGHVRIESQPTGENGFAESTGSSPSEGIGSGITDSSETGFGVGRGS